MMETEFNSWLLMVFGSGCFTALLLYMTPNDKNRKIMEMGCSCVMLLTLFIPLRQFDMDRFNDEILAYRTEIYEDLGAKEDFAGELNKEIIEERLSEYIHTEAEARGLQLEKVEVQVIVCEDGNYLPDSVRYTSDREVDREFKEYIERNLGISVERQYVNENTGERR